MNNQQQQDQIARGLETFSVAQLEHIINSMGRRQGRDLRAAIRAELTKRGQLVVCQTCGNRTRTPGDDGYCTKCAGDYRPAPDEARDFDLGESTSFPGEE
jgi:hypothetical protein